MPAAPPRTASRLVWIVALALAAAWGVHAPLLHASQGGTGGGPLAGTITVRVVEAGTDDGTGNPLPVPGAFVMVGLHEDDPFPGNTGTADGAGQIVFSDPALAGPQSVTAGADGYQFYSFLGVDAAQVVVPLSLRDPAVATSSVTGTLSSFSGVDCDNQIQLAIVTPALSLADLMGFNIQGQLSDPVPIDLLGDTVYVPGNLVIPSQKENPYLWCALFGIEIAKSTYQVYLPTGTTQNLFSFGARVDIGSLVGGEFDLSQIVPIELGLARNVTVTGNMTVNIGMASSLNQNLSLITANTPADSVVMVLSLGEINGDPAQAPGGGDLFLLDFAQLAGGALVGANLRTTPAVAPFGDVRYLSMAVASSSAGLELSGVTGQLDRSDYLPPATEWLSTFFVPVQLDPVNGAEFSFSSAVQPGVSPYPDMNLASLADVTTVPDTRPGAEPGATVDVADKLWTLVSPGEDMAFTLPVLPAGAPAILPFPENTPEDDRLVWSHTVAALSLDPAFDLDAYEMNAFVQSFTHFASDSREFSVDGDGDGIHLFDDNCPALDNEDQADLDGDGLGDACDPDKDGDGYLAGANDCDDLNPAVNPGAPEVCDDTLDNDCDGQADQDDTDCYSCTDNDGDGYYAEGGHCGPLDCQDGNPAISPGAAEACADGIDNDCDGLADDLDPECIPSCTDADGDDAFLEGGACGPVDCNDGNPFIHPGAREACDVHDNDCDPATTDGSGEPWLGSVCDGPDADLCGEGTLQCPAGTPTCTDTSGNSAELCDGMDNDCNPATPDGAGDPAVGAPCDGPDADLCPEGNSVCASGALGCTDGSGDTPEHCDGLDNDCNPATPDGIDDGWVGALCDGPDTDYCPEGSWQCIGATPVCTDSTGENPEVCDGQDNDCDGYIPVEEEDADGDGVRICQGDCNDGNIAVHPGASELCTDGIDNDCDALPDMDDPDCGTCTDLDGDGYYEEGGNCGPADCDDADPDVNPGAAEVPKNGVDDDCNPATPDTPASPWAAAQASTLPAATAAASDAANALGLLVIPLGAVAFLRRRRG